MTFEELMKDGKQGDKVRENLSFLNPDEMIGLKNNPLISKEMLDMLKSLKASVPDSMKKNEGMYRVGMIGGLERLNYFKTMPESIAVSVNANGLAIRNELWGQVEQMKSPQFAASQIAGNIVKEAYGVQPVFVTNWPEDKGESTFEIVQTAASVIAIITALGKLKQYIHPIIEAGKVIGAGAAAATRFIPLIMIGPPEMYDERLNLNPQKRIAQKDGSERNGGFLSVFAGLDLAAQFRDLKPNLGGLNYLAEIILPASAYAGDARLRETAHDESEKPMFEGLTGLAVEGGYKAFNMLDGMFSAFADVLSPSSAFAYDTGTLTNIGNYHGDSVRMIAGPAEGSLNASRPREGNCKCPAPEKIENKVNILIHLHEDGRTYVETDLNTEPKIDVRRGHMD